MNASADRPREPFRSHLVRWLFSAAGVWLASEAVEGIHVADAGSLALAVFVLSLLSTFLKPALVLFALPFVVLTLGFGLWLINALLFWLAGQVLPGFEVAGFWPALWGAAWLSLAGAVASMFTASWRVRVSGVGARGRDPFSAGGAPRPGEASRLPGRPGDSDVIDVESRPS